MRVILAMGCAALMVVATGCGGGGKGPTGTVEGALTVKGSPAPQGTIVQFLSEKGASKGTCGPDGKFTVMGLPVGTYKVAIMGGAGGAAETMSPEQAMMKSQEKGFEGMEAKSGGVPEKYQNVETSGITFEVKEGTNEFVKDLTE